MKLGKKLAAASVGLSISAVLAAPVLANHSSSTYHWVRTSNEITVPVIDNTTGIWAQCNHTGIAVADWNVSPYIEAPLVRGNADPACAIVRDEINVCNDDYGSVGWLGLARITISSGHITGGATLLNDYYFNQDRYNNDTWRQLVTCQEIGHDYGLGHQNENFSTDVTTSCMEYTSQTAGNEGPDAHDYEQLALIYAHSEGGDTGDGGGGGKPGKGGGNGGGGGNGNGRGKKLSLSGTGPADWGTPIGRDAQGRPNIYRRSEASFDVITHVTWAIGEGPDHHDDHTEGHNGPRQHSGDLHF